MSVFNRKKKKKERAEALQDKETVHVESFERVDLSQRATGAIAEAASQGKLNAQIKALHLNEMNLIDYPTEIKDCIHLSVLEMNQNRLTSFPSFIQRTKALETISLMGNLISLIPPEVSSLKAIVTLNLQINQLRVLPPEFFQIVSLRSLDISCNLLEDLPKSITKLSNLERLNARANQIRTIPADLYKLFKLTLLNLADNYLSNFSSGPFSQLIKLSINNNQLKKFELLGVAPNLTELDISHNSLTELVGLDASALKKFDCSYNHLSKAAHKYSNWMQKLVSLESALLSHNQFDEISSSFLSLSKLIDLDLSWNQIATVPDAIAQISTLTSLDLSHNILSVVTGNLFTLSKLTYLDLSNNKLTQLPKELASFAALKVFEISNNHHLAKDFGNLCLPQAQVVRMNNVSSLASLTFLSKSQGLSKLIQSLSGLHSATKLTELHLGGVPLKFFPKDVFALVGLKKLWLNGCKLTQLPAGIKHLSALDLLDYSFNSVTALPTELFTLLSLQELYLNNLGLASFPDGIDQLTNLKMLNISHNFLGKLPKGIGKLKSLEQLNVMECGLTEWTTEPNSTNVQIVHVDGNTTLSTVPDDWKPVVQGLSLRLCAASLLLSLYSRVVGYVANINARRKSMEDTFVVQHELPDLPPSSHVFAVFDGHAGPEAATYCAVNLVPYLLKFAVEKSDNIEGNSLMLRETMAALAHFCNTVEDSSSGCTAGVAFLTGEHLYLATCGDVQVLLVEKGKATVFTNHHVTEDNGERLRIQRLGGYITDQGRVNGTITVARCLGSPKFQPFVSSLGDYVHRPITDDTEYMVLASDGLWKVLGPPDVMAIVEACKETQGNLRLAATHLRDVAFQLGSADNITVIVVDFKCED